MLLHGMFGDATQWEKITPLLQNDYRVITVDLLGHGRSPRPTNATYSAQEHVAALRNTLESIGATQDVTVLGYSMGGSVAVAYAAAYPGDIAQLYLISTPFYLKPDQMVRANYAAAVLMTKLSTWLFGKIEARLHAGKSLDKAVRYSNDSKLFHKMIGAYDNPLETEIVRKNLNQLIHEFDLAEHLARVTAPVTYYTGKKDVFVVQGQLNALKQFCPYMDIHRLDIIKVDHMLVQNLPKEIVGLITKHHAKTLHIGSSMGKGNDIVLVHGIESSSSYWDGLAPALAERNHITTIDLLGFGKSPKPLNIAYSLHDQVSWLKKTLDAQGVTTCDMIGHSLGSLVCLAYAAKYPHAVRSLTLFSPVFIEQSYHSDRFLIRNLRFFQHLADSSYIYSQAARAVGDRYISRYIPSLRSVENAITKQDALELAQSAAAIPTHIAYGERDILIDKPFLRQVAGVFRTSTITTLPDVSHNFPLFAPQTILDSFSGGKPFTYHPRPAHKIPPTFAQQLVKLAAPILWLKSVAYIAFGLLMFTDAMPAAITLGLAGYVVYSGYKMIRGAFSLKNEGLSYISYVCLGIASVFLGWALVYHPKLSVIVSVVTLCAFVLLVGAVRLLVALRWTHAKALRKRLITTGSTLVAVGLLAFAGSIVSRYIIIYSLAAVLILRGMQFGLYATIAFVMAYVRGFNRTDV